MGRKRRMHAARYANGKVKDKPILPHRQRLIDYARLRQPELGSPLGLMLYEGDIEQSLYEAGMAYRGAREALDALLGLPPRQPRGQDLSATGGPSDVEQTQEVAERRLRLERRLREMELVLGEEALPVVHDVVVLERAPAGYEQRLVLIDALRRLSLWTSRGLLKIPGKYRK